MYELSEKEKMIYKYIEQTIDEEGYPPSVRDICAAIGIKSTSTVHWYLQRLHEKGYIKKDNFKSRAVSIEKSPYSNKEKMLRVPVLGKVTAGVPIHAVQNFDGYIDFPVSMSHGSSGLFALKIEGESMCEAGILDGDVVVVDSRKYAENGEIVVAMIDEEATVKRFFKENGYVRLQPENSSMEPIYTRNVEILGKVIANYRFY